MPVHRQAQLSPHDAPFNALKPSLAMIGTITSLGTSHRRAFYVQVRLKFQNAISGQLPVG
jgi:hypothetical protein